METDKSYIIEILKERYEYEQFRRNNFDNAINLPITILALLIGGLAAIVTQQDLGNNIIQYGILIGMFPIGISIYFLIRVYYGIKRNYDVLPHGKDIYEHYEKLHKYHQEIDTKESSPDTLEQTNTSFQEDLINWYSECSKVNCRINDQRMNHFHKSKVWLIVSIAVIFILLCIKVIFQL